MATIELGGKYTSASNTTVTPNLPRLDLTKLSRPVTTVAGGKTTHNYTYGVTEEQGVPLSLYHNTRIDRGVRENEIGIGGFYVKTDDDLLRSIGPGLGARLIMRNPTGLYVAASDVMLNVHLLCSALIASVTSGTPSSATYAKIIAGEAAW